jgi:hypothetical protein|tara:strand:- start:18 stop:1823 length:1806 start_codon:yes stop_codon:yes gene_type:complete
MASYVQVSNLDFQEIKTALKEYLRAQSDFSSYDFEGSAMSVLLDTLAYNTYYTAFNTNMVVNEMFLDSASLRDNVIALAKQLGYRPKSKVAPEARVTFTATYPQASPEVAVLQKGTGFTTVFNDTLYSYVTIEDQSVPVENGVAYFDSVPIYEGTLITSTFVVNTALPSQRFVIQNQGVDTSSVRVKVFESVQSTYHETYDYAENILDVDSTSKAFFLDEVEDERYELFFGDGVLGKKLENGNKIEVSYIVTNGPDTNGAKSFTFNGVVTDKFSNTGFVYNIAVNSAATVAANGGADIESISKIKFNAPKYFSTQDRAVTATDYASIIRQVYPAISDIITFGGEEDSPPEYGKVKIVIKPESASFLSSTTKKQIVDQMKKYMVASVTPEIVDPSILYIEATSSIFYSTSITTQKPEEIRNKVISGINSYLAQSTVEKFNGKFRFSKFVSTIDNSDRSINSNATSIMMRKDFYPQINSTSFYEVCFQNEFDKECDGPTLMSTGFKVTEFPSYTVYFEDRDGVIALYRLDSLTGEKITLNDSIGSVDYAKGEIMLFDLTIVQGSFSDNKIEIRVKPLSNDVNASRELYLDVDVTKSKFTVYPE